MAKNIHVFKNSKKTGDSGEIFVMNYLSSSPFVDSVIDVSDSKMYQDIDVDLLVKMKNGTEYKVEVKTDTYVGKNMVYETVSAIETNSIGCFEKTQCDYMFYYFENMDIMYILKMDEFREWFRSNKEEFKRRGYRKEIKNQRKYGQGTYTSVVYAYPMKLVEREEYDWWSKLDLTKEEEWRELNE